MQTIIIKNLIVNSNHGVLDSEKNSTQPFVISAKLSLENFVISDDITSTINYVEVCDCIVEAASSDRYNLIETLSDNIAKAILDKFSLVIKAKVKVKKPQAPIAYNLDYVAASSERKISNVFLGLGSNLGDREGAIKNAIKALNKTSGISVLKTSSIIESKPYGAVVQPDFLNAAIKIKTYFSPLELLAIVKNIEKLAGRKKREKWGARELDIDILIYEGIELDTDVLVLPHKDMHNRDFVLKPLAEIK